MFAHSITANQTQYANKAHRGDSGVQAGRMAPRLKSTQPRSDHVGSLANSRRSSADVAMPICAASRPDRIDNLVSGRRIAESIEPATAIRKFRKSARESQQAESLRKLGILPLSHATPARIAFFENTDSPICGSDVG
jgi:hypothetical protein